MILSKFEKAKYLERTLLLTIVSLLFAVSVFSETGNINNTSVTTNPALPINEYLNEITYYDLQMGAVSIDMYLYLGWASDEKDDMQKAAGIAIERLDSIIKDVNGLNAPKETADMKANFLSAVQYLKDIYRGIEKKDSDTLKKEFDTFKEKYTTYEANYKKVRSGENRQDTIKKPDPDFSGKELSDNYIKALNLIKEMKYKEALGALLSSKNKVDKNSAAYDYVILSLSDVAGKMAYNFENVSSEDKSLIIGGEEIIKYSVEILNKEYSPLFMDFFVRWRTATQSFHNGVSNWSNIPNWEYNIKRKELINKVKSYFKSNPRDNWARAQIMELLTIDNIARGGSMGNDTLNYMGMLYPLPEDKTSPAEHKKDISEDLRDIPPTATMVE